MKAMQYGLYAPAPGLRVGRHPSRCTCRADRRRGRLAPAPSLQPPGAGGVAQAAEPHSAAAWAGRGGQSLSTVAAVDPAYFSPSACAAFPPTVGNRHLTVFLDAGHGGPDPGAVGITTTEQVIDEADQTLPVVLDTMRMLRRAGFRVVVSRTGPTSVLRLGPGDMSGHLLTVTGSHDDVAARDVCANMAHADVLIGVYFNSGPSPANAGCITAYDAARPFSADNLRLAGPGAGGRHRRDERAGLADPRRRSPVRSGARLLAHPRGPCLRAPAAARPGREGLLHYTQHDAGALIEPLFITDPFEGSIAASSHGQQVIAAGLARAVKQYFAPGSAP
jgi:N-acetylmuramoyl-L-alanine amidase